MRTKQEEQMQNMGQRLGQQVGIVGLGLMGGSMGLALKKTQCFGRVLGYDANPPHSQQALALGLVDECVGLSEIAQCEVIFLAVPVEGILSLIATLSEFTFHPHTTIIDMGGTKAEILRCIPKEIRSLFVGSHPMCGTEFFGPKAAFDSLYENGVVILSDLDKSGAYQIEMAKSIFTRIGMKIFHMDSQEHDQHLALISHMPHIVSYALANAVLSQEDPQTILALVGGGFRSMSRLSKSSPLMWKDIFKQNKNNVLSAMTHFQNKFEEARGYIEREDWNGLEEFMRQANALQKFL